jgi:hypothetical protein
LLRGNPGFDALHGISRTFYNFYLLHCFKDSNSCEGRNLSILKNAKLEIQKYLKGVFFLAPAPKPQKQQSIFFKSKRCVQKKRGKSPSKNRVFPLDLYLKSSEISDSINF